MVDEKPNEDADLMPARIYAGMEADRYAKTCKMLFKMADIDNDGFLTIIEFQKLSRACIEAYIRGGDFEKSEVPESDVNLLCNGMEKQNMETFKDLDKGKQGKINWPITWKHLRN